jgi:hypothetical protein
VRLNFFDSHDCRSGRHCGACRARSGEGPQFRASIARAYRLPVVDFDCPHGRAWGEVPPPPPPVDPDEAALLQAAANPEGWGDHVAAAIHRIGADRVYKMVREAAGRPAGCGGCNARREALNRLEGWVKGVFSRKE